MTEREAFAEWWGSLAPPPTACEIATLRLLCEAAWQERAHRAALDEADFYAEGFEDGLDAASSA